MRNLFTADMHFGHANVIGFCKRPYANVDEMNSTLIHNWNQCVKPDDTVYHIGDFCFRGGVQGGKTKAQMWEDKLNGKVIHIQGNHDVNNGTKALITHAIMQFGGHEILATHRPPTMKAEVPDFCDFVICGHIHEKWKFLYDPEGDINVPIINVGIDVWKFRPVRLTDIIVLYDAIIKGTAK